jgi:hypothetical protein
MKNTMNRENRTKLERQQLEEAITLSIETAFEEALEQIEIGEYESAVEKFKLWCRDVNVSSDEHVAKLEDYNSFMLSTTDIEKECV